MLQYIAKGWNAQWRRAHHLVKGAHHLESGVVPSVGWGAATSPISKRDANSQILKVQGCATSHNGGLPTQGCATSPRGAHFSICTCLKLDSTSPINSQSNQVCSLWPSPWLLGFYFAFNMSPHVPLFLPLLIFIDFIWLFWVLWAKMTFKWLKSLFLLN